MTVHIYQNSKCLKHHLSKMFYSPGSDLLLRTLALELKECGFDDIDFPHTSASIADRIIYTRFLQRHPTFITVHHLTKPILLDVSHVPIEHHTDSVTYIRPEPHIYDFANMGKRVESHFIVAGPIKTGKTLLAKILKHTIETFAPGAAVYLIEPEGDDSHASSSIDDYKKLVSENIKNNHHVFGKKPDKLVNNNY